MISSVPEFSDTIPYLIFTKSSASAEILLVIVTTCRRWCGRGRRSTGSKLELNVSRSCNFGVLLTSVVMSFNSHFRLHDNAFECWLVCVDSDAFSLRVFRTVFTLQVVVMDSRKVLVTHSVVTHISIPATIVRERRNWRFPWRLFSYCRQRGWFVVQVRVLDVVSLLACRTFVVHIYCFLFVVWLKLWWWRWNPINVMVRDEFRSWSK